MSDNSAGTKTCSTCHGEPWGFKTKCPTCSGTGLDTTGAVVGVLEPLHGMAFNLEDARGHIKRLSEQNAALLQQVDAQQETIAAQAAEIARLKGDIEELTIQRDTAIEARDELRADRDNWKKLFTDHLAVESKLRARIVVLEGVEMLNGTIASSNQRQVEKLERVIEALRESIVRREESHIALYRSLILMANAGLELPEVEDHE